LLASDDEVEVAGNARLENESAMPEPTKIAIITATATGSSPAASATLCAARIFRFIFEVNLRMKRL
jgi:hypothetical protein